jgi:MFS family permease
MGGRNKLTKPYVGLELRSSQKRSAIIAATIGNGLEFYDFITFAFFAIQIGHTFFPSENSFLSLMGSLATFGAGFITRPLGAFILGGYADRHGRKPAMLISMGMMGVSIILLILTPGYQVIGIAAPIIAVSARLIQGFALGGEIGAATPYLMESADTYRRGRALAWQGGSQQVATTLGALVGFLLSLVMAESALTAYGWRIALGLGALVVPFALWIRSRLPETLNNKPEPDDIENLGIRSYFKIIVLGSVMIASGAIGTYVFNYMATFGQHTLKLSTSVSLFAEFGVNFTQLITIILGGWMSDKWGRKYVMVIPQTIFVLAIVPCFLWVTISLTPAVFIFSTLFLGAVASPQYAAVYATINESLPRVVRARVFALMYSIPVAIFGGTTQPFVAWLLHITGKPIALAWYLMIVSAIGLVAMCLMHETSPAHRARKSINDIL